jgi:hypothetical protein
MSLDCSVLDCMAFQSVWSAPGNLKLSSLDTWNTSPEVKEPKDHTEPETQAMNTMSRRSTSQEPKEHKPGAKGTSVTQGAQAMDTRKTNHEPKEGTQTWNT